MRRARATTLPRPTGVPCKSDPTTPRLIAIWAWYSPSKASSLRRSPSMSTRSDSSPTWSKLHVNLAAVFSRQGKFPEAVACCRRAIQLQPGLAETYCCLGNACATSVSLPRRSTASARIWSWTAERAETYNLLGNAYKEQGRLDEALEAYQRAMQFQPDLRDAHTNFLLASHYRPSLAAAELAALHVEWDDRHGSALAGRGSPMGILAMRTARYAWVLCLPTWAFTPWDTS